MLQCEKAVYLRDAAAGSKSTNESREKEARAWLLVLDGVAPAAIVPATLAAIKAKPNSYPPSARDVLAAATGEEWQTDENGKAERVVCANGGAYESWEAIKARAEMLSTHALSEPLPPLEIEPEALKRALGLVRAETQSPSAPVEKSEDPDVRNFGALAVDMARPSGIDLHLCTPTQIADLRAFGSWWITYRARELITKESFAAAWPHFEQWRVEQRARPSNDAENNW